MAEFGPEHLANYINHFSEEERLGTLTAVLEMLDWAWQKDEAYKMARFAGKVQGYDQLAFERDFLNPQAASDDEISVDIRLEDVAADNQAESSKGNRKSGPNKKSLFDGVWSLSILAAAHRFVILLRESLSFDQDTIFFYRK